MFPQFGGQLVKKQGATQICGVKTSPGANLSENEEHTNPRRHDVKNLSWGLLMNSFPIPQSIL